MVFEEVKLTWGGKTFTCPPDRVWLMIQHLEKSGVDIMGITQEGGIVNKCLALSESLNFLGMEKPPSPEDVYCLLFSNQATNLSEFILGLQMMVIPPNIRKQALEMTPEEAEQEAKKPKARKRKKAS